MCCEKLLWQGRRTISTTGQCDIGQNREVTDGHQQALWRTITASVKNTHANTLPIHYGVIMLKPGIEGWWRTPPSPWVTFRDLECLQLSKNHKDPHFRVAAERSQSCRTAERCWHCSKGRMERVEHEEACSGVWWSFNLYSSEEHGESRASLMVENPEDLVLR